MKAGSNVHPVQKKKKLNLPFWKILYPLLMTIRKVMERDGSFLQNSHVFYAVLLST